MTGSAPSTTAPVEPMTPYEAHIAKVVAAAPPLTAEQEARIRGLFRPGVASTPALPMAA
ncbi:hypothetical protein [Streptomyces sp. NBC_01233]|uniref:hypothetical protein n=1 Tax=Streptomyces sp. NBC_01233 TaxID=2903787 RepID=UPI002E11E78D|nr:hypothetical protein OG332_10485 [Streptomyces sp. NBC_01233]